MSTEYVTVKDLPPSVQDALRSVGYGRKDIGVIASTSVELGGSAGDGSRAFTTLVNLTSGQYRTEMGSWGGPNMFTSNAVDSDKGRYALPADGVAIKGSKGGGQPVFAQLYVPASMVAKILPAAPEDLTETDKNVLGCFMRLKSGQYRQDALKRHGGTADVVDSLVGRGYLSRNRAGATAITTAGKNHASASVY